MNGQNIPNSDQKTVKAKMQVKSFRSEENPTQKDLKKLEGEVNTFLSTIENKTRFLNGRNSYAIGKRAYVLIWYLERLENKPVTTPFGKQANVQIDNTKEKEA